MHDTTSRKRPYQPDIAAFFPRAETNLPIREDSTTINLPTPISAQPQLPTYVQSSLLNVGMRIRKAVPEGYIRQKMLEAEKTTEDQENYGSKAASRQSSSAPRELQPFAYCPSSRETSSALHEIGGWNAQPTFHTVQARGLNHVDEDNFTSSQESNSSTDSIPPKAKGKRAFEEDDADDEAEIGNNSTENDTFSYMMQQNLWARPRNSRGKRKAFAWKTGRTLAPTPNFIPDFGEADFLRPLDEETMDTT